MTSGIDNITKISNGIKNYNTLLTQSQEHAQSWTTAISSNNAVLGEYLNTVKDGSASLGGYVKFLISAKSETLALSIAQKTATVIANAFKTALNMAVVMAVSYGIEKLVEYISNLKTASEQAKADLDTATQNLTDTNSKVNDLNTKLKDTNQQIETLKAKGTLTFVEQSQLTTAEKMSKELQTQLEIQQALQKIGKTKQTDAAVKTINTQNEEKINPFNGTVNTDKNIDAKSGIQGTNEALAFYAARLSQVNKDQEEYNKLLSKGNNLTDEEKKKKETLAYILKDDDAGTALKENLLNRAKAYQEEADAIDIDSATNKTAAQQAKKTAQDQANAILKVVDAENYAKQQTNNFNSVWNNKDYKTTTVDLQSLAQQGKLTAATLNNAKYSTFTNAMKELGLTIPEVIQQIDALSKAQNDNNSASKQAAESNKELVQNLKDLMSSNVANYQSMQGILDDVKSYGTLSSNDLNTILKIFPDMASAVLEYNSGLKSTGSMVDLIKQKMQSLQSSYQQELQQELANNEDFYNSTIGKHTDLTNQLLNLYGIDYKNYTTYQQLKSAIDTAIANATIGNSQDTAASLAQTYYANVKNYGDYETAKQNVTSQVLADIQNMNITQLSKLAAVYGIDVKNFGDTQSGKVQIAGQIATKIAEVYGAVNEGFSSSVSDQLKNLQEEKAALQAGTLPGSSAWSSSQRSSALSEVNKEISTYQNLIKGMSGDTTDLTKKIDAITNIKPIIPSTSSALKSAASDATKAAKSAETAANKAEEAAKKAAEALKKQYEAELKIIEANKEMDKYKPDKYGVEGLQYYNALLALYNKWKNSALDSDDKLELQEKVLSAHKSYEQNILDVSYKELDNRIKLGKTEENSINHLNNLLQIQKLLNSANMSLVNTQENQLELQQKIYDVRKQYAQDIIDKSYKQQQHRESLGIDYNSSLSNDINGDRGILQNLLDIQKLLLNGGTAQPANTEENRWELEEKIYDQKKKILEDDISDLDTQVQLGNIQENSLGYLSKLYSLKQEIIKSDLNAIDKGNELNSIEAKILDARKSYIQQLQSDLSDESIVGSYGYRIKQIQDQIDAINNQADAESKELIVEKAKAAWEEAQNNKTVQIYTNKSGFVYEADQSDVTEKKQAYSDAEREEQIEKLTEQKDAIQREEDEIKSQLDNALKVLQGMNNQAWSNIATQINNVLGKVVVGVTNAVNSNEDSWDEQNEALDDSTDNQITNYKNQTNAVKQYMDSLAKMQPQITNYCNTMASAYTRMADAIYYTNNEYDRLIRLMSDVETVRETENERYNDYNRQSRQNGNTVKYYASGTQDSVSGLVKKNEQGYELTFSPTDSGNFEILKEHSKVFTAQETESLHNLANGVNPQIAAIKASIDVGKVGNNISNKTISSDVTNKYQIEKIEFPNATDTEEIKNAFVELPLFLKQKEYQSN